MYQKYFKRVLDIVFSFVLLIVLLPIELIVGILCTCSTGQMFYKQKRDGKDRKSFVLYKFRSMKDIPGGCLARTNRVTRFLRLFGLDELPQLFNILKGDMSFVGPRPFITGEKLPSKPSKKIFSVKPGLISMAISYGRHIAYESRLMYDETYASNVTLKQDIKIVFRTIITMIKQI